MNTKFSVAFGISLILVGTISYYINVNDGVTLGISISALLFSMINLFLLKINDSKKCELLYFIPFFVLLLFSCFSNRIVNTRLYEVFLSYDVSTYLSFISFGLLFIGEYFYYRKKNDEYKNDYNDNIKYEIEFYDRLVNHLASNKNDNDLLFDEITKELSIKLEEYKIRGETINNRRDNYSIKEVDEIIKNTFLKINNDVINKHITKK